MTAQVFTFKKLNIHKTSGSLLLHSSSNFKCIVGLADREADSLEVMGRRYWILLLRRSSWSFLSPLLLVQLRLNLKKFTLPSSKWILREQSTSTLSASTSLTFHVKLIDYRVYCSIESKWTTLNFTTGKQISNSNGTWNSSTRFIARSPSFRTAYLTLWGYLPHVSYENREPPLVETVTSHKKL